MTNTLPTDPAELRRLRANVAQVLRIQFARPPERRSYLLIRECLARARAIDTRLAVQANQPCV